MVGMATRANNNPINKAGLGVKGKHKKFVLTVLRKLHRCCREDFEPMTVQLFFEDRNGGCQD